MRKLLFFSLISAGIILTSCRTQKNTNGEASAGEISTPASTGVSHDTINKKVEIRHQGQDQKSIDSIKDIKNKKKNF